MVSVGVLIDVQGAFPGWIALWPLLSAAAIIVAGQSGSPLGLDRILASRPLVRLGDASYALYLVHWPLLITYLVLRDRPVAGPRSGVAIILVSLLLAVAATKLVERPFQRWAWPERDKRRLAASVAVSLALVAGAVLPWTQRGREPRTLPSYSTFDISGIQGSTSPDSSLVRFVNGATVQPRDGTTTFTLGRVQMSIMPLLTFRQRSPDRC